MTEDISRLEDKLDELLEALPLIYALGAILVPRQTVNERVGLNKNTLAQNENVTKYEEVGKRKTYVEVGSVAVVKQRKRRVNSPVK
jgi:low affinity Fe/Cu permease